MAEFDTSLIDLREPTVKVFEHVGRDVHKDTMKTARNVGRVRLDHSRLNIFSFLAEGDAEDNFKFNVDSTGGLRLGTFRDAGTRFQFYDNRGRLIADSKQGTGREHNKYLRMIGGEKGGEPFKPGEYFIKVSRLKNGETTPERGYALQLQMGDTFFKDFDTKELDAKEFKPGDVQPFDPTEGARQTAATIQGALMVNAMVVGLDYLKLITSKAFKAFSLFSSSLFR